MATVLVEPLTWQQVKDLVTEGSLESLFKLGRSEEQLAVYRAHRARVLCEFETMQDYMRAKVYRLPLERTAEGKLRVAQGMEASQQAGPVIVGNDFPYLLENDISHVCTWNPEPLPASEVDALVATHLPCTEHCSFVNPVELQSVREVWHAHVFCRNLEVQVPTLPEPQSQP